MQKHIYIFLILIIFTITMPTKVSADVDVVSSSGDLNIKKIEYEFDPRVYKLRIYLDSRNSPLSEYSEIFVQEADKNKIDWRLIPAISGVESSFGIHIPNKSFNAYGWANGEYNFSSWEESISSVSAAINNKYYEKGANNIIKISKRYAPPSKTWAGKVKYFMNKIDPIPIEFDF
jgi:hypothetical protein